MDPWKPQMQKPYAKALTERPKRRPKDDTYGIGTPKKPPAKTSLSRYDSYIGHVRNKCKQTQKAKQRLTFMLVRLL